MVEFIKYPKIYAFGHDENKDLLSNPEHKLVIQEKVDGANFRFMFNKGNIIFGSRTQQLTSSTGEETNVSKNFRRCLSFIKEQIPKEAIKKHDRLIFFGECCVKHSMDYDWDKIPAYLGFDIYDIESDKMIPFKEAKAIFKELNLDFVPVIKELKAKDIVEVDEKMIPISAYAPRGNPDQQAEGIVIKNYENGIMAKLVTANFKEINAEVFGGTPKFQEDDSGKIIARYCTNARIEKIIFKLVDEGHKLEMKLMAYLPRLVHDDIWEENWKEIVQKYDEIKTKDIKRMVAKRCVAVLNQVIINNALNK